MRAFIIIASFVLCLICIAMLPWSLPVVTEAYGVAGALVAGMALGTGAIIMAVQGASFLVDALHGEG